MPNNDQVNLRYYGLVNSEASHEATRFRVHWICKQASGRSVLDVGCSQGITSILLGREGFQVTGIDLEETSINYANEELKKESALVQENVKFLLNDASLLDKSFGKFDTVILGEVLEHFAHPHKLLTKLYLLLNNKGNIIITVPFGYHPFHDHKQTFYIGNFSYYLQPYFEEIKLEVHHKYICYAGRKRDQMKSYKKIQYTPNQLQRWMQLDEENFNLIERKTDKMLRERKEHLDAKDKLFKELRKQLKGGE
jgi:cyclopropane fatty-acyl-phospholipid synthase-like methyltransferase